MAVKRACSREELGDDIGLLLLSDFIVKSPSGESSDDAKLDQSFDLSCFQKHSVAVLRSVY